MWTCQRYNSMEKRYVVIPKGMKISQATPSLYFVIDRIDVE